MRLLDSVLVKMGLSQPFRRAGALYRIHGKIFLISEPCMGLILFGCVL